MSEENNRIAKLAMKMMAISVAGLIDSFADDPRLENLTGKEAMALLSKAIKATNEKHFGAIQ